MDVSSKHCVFELMESGQDDDTEFEVQLSEESFETYELDPPQYNLTTTKKELKQMYRDMVAIRYCRAISSRPAPAAVAGRG